MIASLSSASDASPPLWIPFACLAALTALFLLLVKRYFAGMRRPLRREAGPLAALSASALLAALGAARLAYETFPLFSAAPAFLVLLVPALAVFFGDLILLAALFLRSRGAVAPAGAPPARPLAASLRRPALAAFLLALGYFLLHLLLFRPGYETDDDISIILMACGYLGGEPVPFLFFSNVLLGFLLTALYGLRTVVNWEIWLFAALDFLSVWVLLWLLFSRFSDRGARRLGTAAVFLCNSYFLLHFNFTTIAAFACLAGMLLLLEAVPAGTALRRGRLAGGLALLLAGSLVRLDSLWLVLALTLPVVVLCRRAFDLRNLGLALSLAGLLVASSWGSDRLYLRAAPEWQTFQSYTQARAVFHDTPRRDRMEAAAFSVGWSENDLLLFRHWFFPDPAVYSLETLRAMAAQTPPAAPGLSAALTLLARRFAGLDALPSLLAVFAVWLVMARKGQRKAALCLAALLAACALLAAALAWTQKLPNRVFLPMLACVLVHGLFLPGWAGGRGADSPGGTRRGDDLLHLGRAAVGLALLAAVGLAFHQAAAAGRENAERQRVYRALMVALEELRAGGAIPEEALIVSAGRGMPLHWSNPFVLDLPPVQTLELGWLTFSPPYEAVLRQYGIASLPAALYRRADVYLMTRPEMLEAIRVFLEEHEGVVVEARTVFRFGDLDSSLLGDLMLYQLEPGE